MQITPEPESLKYLFDSDIGCNETIEQVKTKVPGFAISSRSWLSFLPEVDVEALPAFHLCDILTVAENNDVCLWVIVADSNEQFIRSQLHYALGVGRYIKHRLLEQNRKAPNLTVYCRLYSTQTEANKFIKEHTYYRIIQSTQKMLHLMFHEMGNFDGLREGIASLVLSKQTSISNYVGEKMSLTLSAKQAKALLDRKKVTHISSPPGTGKTLCGISVYREYGNAMCVYICSTLPLLQYLRYNGCEGTLIQNGQDLCSHLSRGTFANKKCIVIDESHHLGWSRETWKKLFVLLKENRDMFLFVFGDNEFQSFDPQKPLDVASWIMDLSREVLGTLPRMETFKEMYRSTKKVVSFLQHADDRIDITYANHLDGDGIQCIVMHNLWTNSAENSLVHYLRPVLLLTPSSMEAKYQVTDVTILLDGGYTGDKVDDIHRILREQLPGVSTHASDKFPRDGIVVDRIESFIGLDAGLCIFLLSPILEHRISENSRYRIFLASRATHKAVFVVSKIDAAFAESMKFDYFQVRNHFE